LASTTTTATPNFTVTQFGLLASSLVPALLVLAIRLYPSYNAGSVALAAAGLLLITVLARAMRARDATNAQPIMVTTVEDESNQVPGYVITYIFPFLFLSTGTIADLAACLVFALFALVLIYRTDLALVNPLLLILGYHLFRLGTTTDKVILISKLRPLPGQTVIAVRIADRTYQFKSIAE
jgi:hypothetical protein